MIKKRSRPQPHVRAVSPEDDQQSEGEQNDEEKLAVADLIELRKLRKSRLGIDATKLSKGDSKRRRTRDDGLMEVGGLRKGADIEEDEEHETERMKKTLRTTNFTQQTNALDVDKHMMAYIEENLKIRSRPKEDAKVTPTDPQEALYQITDRWKLDKQKAVQEGSVTNSLSMLTAIPEVDLGMDTRLKNIEETEKAKRVVAEERHDKQPVKNDEAHLVASRFYTPHLKNKSDEDIIRDAKMEAMGLPPQDHHHHKRPDKPQLATDEAVMERFKKRMRKG